MKQNRVVIETGSDIFYLHPTFQPIRYQKKWVGKGQYYNNIPIILNAEITKSPFGGFVVRAFDTWMPVSNATEVGEFRVTLDVAETLKRKRPVAKIV